MAERKRAKFNVNKAAAGGRMPQLGVFIFFFVYLCLYDYFIVLHTNIPELSGEVLTYHIVDYSFGFCTKLLPGAIFHLFFDSVTKQTVAVYAWVLYVISLALVSFFISKVVSSIEEKGSRVAVLIICIFFVTGPSTINMFATNVGVLDFYWFLFALLFLIFAENKYLKYLVPLLFAAEILVHFGSIICYVIFMGMVMLFKCSAETDKKQKRILFALLVVSVALTLGLFVYFMIFEQSNVTIKSMQEFNDELFARAGENADAIHYKYYDFAFFRDEAVKYPEFYEQIDMRSLAGYNLSLPLPEKLNDAVNMMLSQVVYTLHSELIAESHRGLKLIVYVYGLLLPVVAFVYSIYIKLIKEEKDKLTKLCFILPLIQFPFCSIVGLLNSVDINRWIGESFIIFMGYFLYVVYKRSDVSELVKTSGKKIDWRLLLSYYFVYANVTLNFFTS